MEVAETEHAQLRIGVVPRAGRDSVGGPLRRNDHQVAERARFLEDARERGLDILADLCVPRELLDLVDDNQLARISGQRRSEAAAAQRLVARGEVIGGGGEASAKSSTSSSP